jgi:hypothetical protein
MSAKQNKNYFFCSATHGYSGDPAGRELAAITS